MLELPLRPKNNDGKSNGLSPDIKKGGEESLVHKDKLGTSSILLGAKSSPFSSPRNAKPSFQLDTSFNFSVDNPFQSNASKDITGSASSQQTSTRRKIAVLRRRGGLK
jgi:hypothetical protein